MTIHRRGLQEILEHHISREMDRQGREGSPWPTEKDCFEKDLGFDRSKFNSEKGVVNRKLRELAKEIVEQTSEEVPHQWSEMRLEIDGLHDARLNVIIKVKLRQQED